MTALNLSELMDRVEREGQTAKSMRTRTSMEWFASTIGKEFGGKTRDKRKREQLGSDLMRSEPVYLTENIRMGKMFSYFYDPKLKATLPYYDMFPLVFPFADAKSVSGEKSFLGINIHYLHPRLRAQLMEALYETETKTKFAEGKRLQISYDILKSASQYTYFKPCVKQYLITHVRSKFLEIPYDAWPIAAMLPMAQFAKRSDSAIWAESYRKAMR